MEEGEAKRYRRQAEECRAEADKARNVRREDCGVTDQRMEPMVQALLGALGVANYPPADIG
jgi:hypothetical protein